MASEYIEPLNLKYILINTFSGSPEIFTWVFFLFICVIAGLFKMDNRIFLLMISLAGVLLYNWFGGGIYLLILLVGGIAIFWSVSRIVKT